MNKLYPATVCIPDESTPAQIRVLKEVENKMEFLGGLMNAFREQRQVDVWLKAGDETDAIPAHKLILAARSKMFRNILESDDCKASSKDTITLSEMTRDELETFLEFMYNGSLPETKLVKHVRGLYVAADKYEVPHLQDICRNKLIASLDPSNAFDVIELAKVHSDRILELDVYEFLTSGMDEIFMSRNFESFVESNPALTVQMIRGYVRKLKKEEAVQMIRDYVRKLKSHPALTVQEAVQMIRDYVRKLKNHPALAVQQYKRLNSCPSD